MDNAYEYTIRLRDQVSQTLNRVGGGLGGMHRKLMQSQASFRDLGQQFLYFNQAAQVIEGAHRSLENLTRPGVEFQSSLADLKAITGLTDEEIQKLGASARKTAKEFGTDAAKGVEAYKMILSRLGPELAKTPEVLDEMSRSAKYLEKVLGGDTVAATNALTTAMNQFQVDMSDPIAAAADMERMMNAMGAAAKEGSEEVQPMTAALERSGMAAKTAKVSFEETLTYIQILGRAGRQGAEGGTALQAVLGRLSRAEFMPKRTADALKEAGVDIHHLADTSLTLTERLKPLNKIVDDTSMMQLLFGEAHFASAIAMVKGAEGADEFTEKITGTNTVIEQAEIIMGTHAERMKRLQARFRDFGVSVFNVTQRVLPMTAAFAQSAQMATQFIPIMNAMRVMFIKAYQGTVKLGAGMIALTKRTVLYMKTLSAKAVLLKTVAAAKTIYRAAVLAATGQIKLAAAAKMAFNAAFLASPIGWIVAGIGAIAGAYVLLRRRTDEATAAERAMQNVRQRAEHSIAGEVVEIRRLKGVMQDENATREQKITAYNRLIEISPEYFGKLSFEEAQTKRLIETSEDYIESLRRQARVKAAEEKMVEMEREYIDARHRLEEADERVSEFDERGLVGQVFDFVRPGFRTAVDLGARRSAQRKLDKIESEREAYGKLLKGLYDDTDKDKIPGPGGKLGDPLGIIESHKQWQRWSSIARLRRREPIEGVEQTDAELGRSVSTITGGGRRATNVNISMGNLIESFTIHTQTTGESMEELKSKVVEVLTQSINSANATANAA